jgi:serine/threonine protein kinase
MAPELRLMSREVLSREHRDPYAADMWAVGCIAYFVLTQESPFHNIVTLLDYVRDVIPCPVFTMHESISDLARDFMAVLLGVKANQRPVVGNARQHRWLVEPPFGAAVHESLYAMFILISPPCFKVFT